MAANIDPTAIAKLIRADLKATQNAGMLAPSLTLPVRVDHFSGSSSVDVTVKGYTGAISDADGMIAAIKKVCADRIATSYWTISNTVYLAQSNGMVVICA